MITGKPTHKERSIARSVLFCKAYESADAQKFIQDYNVQFTCLFPGSITRFRVIFTKRRVITSEQAGIATGEAMNKCVATDSVSRDYDFG